VAFWLHRHSVKVGQSLPSKKEIEMEQTRCEMGQESQKGNNDDVVYKAIPKTFYYRRMKFS